MAINQLIADAMRIAKSKRRKNPAFITLGQKHGATGALFGALMDIFSVGRQPTFKDIGRAQDSFEDIGARYEPGSLETIPLKRLAEQQGLDPDAKFLVDTIPTSEKGPYSPQVPEDEGVNIGSVPGPKNRSAIPDMDYDPTTGGKFVRSVRRVGRPGTLAERLVTGTDRDRTPQDPAMRDYMLAGLMPPLKGEEDIFAKEILTPESSNVFAFAYDEMRGILYVTYRVPEVNKDAGLIRDINSCNGKEYSYYPKVNKRGPMYAYGGAGNPVPKSIYEEMRAASSKGKFVWDKLRVCGSVNEHQYKYTLVSPSMEGSLYIPRKAVRVLDPETNESKLGFRVRAVPTVGRGRRPYLTSDGDYVY